MRRFHTLDDILEKRFQEQQEQIDAMRQEIVELKLAASKQQTSRFPKSEQNADEKARAVCSACNGFSSELTVYSGKILCRQCASQKVDEKTRADLWCPR